MVANRYTTAGFSGGDKPYCLFVHWTHSYAVEQAGIQDKCLPGMVHRSTPLSTASHMADRHKQPVLNQSLLNQLSRLQGSIYLI